ncbi:MAG: aldehyde ferredoxin oxidoreductase, partial [Oscillospiraceae bacterium]|nr:aldehyde ferredoxin oxidoreductase [Oscillospiraceae bacterium]
DSSVLSIGIAGEKKVLLAAIMNDKDRAAGRSGVGAVMGSKKLKGIVVTASKKNADETLASVDALKAANKDVMVNIRENGLTGGGLRALGTASLVNVINGIGALPTKNWQESYYDKAEDVSGEALAEKFLVKAGACHRCPIACGRVVKVGEKVVGGPEYEPLWAYGANMANPDLASINEANYWCNEYGLDAISVPCTIAAAMELYQRGAIKPEDCDGALLEWGNAASAIEWTKRMGDPKTELDWLMSSGSARLCEHYGMPEVSMAVKKQEMPAYDARGVQGIGITYATSNRGGCHVRGYTIAPEVVGLPVQLDRTVTNEKAFWSKTFQDLTSVIDSMGLCLFTSFALGAPEYTKLLNAACGTDYTPEQVLEIGERIYNIERMFNKAAGMKPEDDRLPKRLLTEPVPDGPSKGMTSKLEITLPDYYKVRGWENAFPTDETLKRLGLDECIGK